MTETLELREKPAMKFMLTSDTFNIEDAHEPKNNETYGYAEVCQVELQEERTDKFVTASAGL